MTTYAIIILIIIVFGLLIWKTWNEYRDAETHRLSYLGKCFTLIFVYGAMSFILLALFWQNDVFFRWWRFLFWIPLLVMILLTKRYNRKEGRGDR